MKTTSFREFLQQNDGMEEEKKDIENTLNKIPPSHRRLVDGYQWKFHAGNTLNGDDEHVGYVDDHDKVIAVAGPWNYGREFCLLHEVAHKVWDRLVDPNLRAKWNQIVKHMTDVQKKDKSVHQEPVELFCMSYAQYYASTKLEKFNNPVWQQFIKALPK